MKNFKNWLKCALVRSIKTMAQTSVSLITVGATMLEVDWVSIASVSLVAGILSILTSVAGLPEVKDAEIVE